VSKERVRQLEERAKRRMRERIEEITREPLAQSA
jgi:RNA polymerase sigma-32 factor